MLKNQKKSMAGLSLVEVMVAAIIMLIIALGAASVIPMGFRSNQLSKEHATANQAVSKIMEQLNALTFAEITTGTSPEPEYPTALIDTRNYTYPSQKVTINGIDYPRKLTIDRKSYRIDMLVYKGKHNVIAALPGDPHFGDIASLPSLTKSLTDWLISPLLITPVDAATYTCSISPPSGTYYTGTSISFTSTTNVTGGPSYAWSFSDGTTATGSTKSHSFSSSGTKTINLTVTKSPKVATCSSTVTIQAPEPTPAPTATPASTAAPTSVDIDITHADGSGDNNGYTNTTEFKFEAIDCISCGSNPTYRWNFGPQEGAEVTGNPITHIFTSAGSSKTVTLTVEGGSGATKTAIVNLSSSNVTISVTPGLAGNVGQQFTFTANCTTCGTSPTYQWDFGNFVGSPSSSNTANYTYTQADTYTVTVEVTGGSNPSATTSVQISSDYSAVMDVSPALSGIAGPETESDTTDFTFKAKSSGFDNNDVVDYTYTFSGGVVISSISCPNCTTTPALSSPVTLRDTKPNDSTYPSVVLTYPTGGTFQVELHAQSGSKVGHSTGNVNLDSVAVIKAEGSDSGTTTVEVGEEVNFDANDSKGVGSVVQGAWNFGDGENDEGPSASTSHAYAAEGSYTVTLNITGGSNPSTTKVITVVPPETTTISTETSSGQHEMKKIYLKVAPWSNTPPNLSDYISTFVFLKAENKEP